MNGLHSAIAICVITSSPAFAGDFNSAATPRELAHCMMKRFHANTAESYRDAFKACKNEFDSVRNQQSSGAVLTASTLPESSK